MRQVIILKLITSQWKLLQHWDLNSNGHFDGTADGLLLLQHTFWSKGVILLPMVTIARFVMNNDDIEM